MPTYTGHLLASPDRADSVNNQSADLDGFTVDYWPGHESLMGAPLAQSGYTDNLPVAEQGNTLQGHLLHSYLQDYYFRIHLFPSLLDLGDVSVDQVRTVEVWNAYLTDQLLSVIVETDTTGLQFTEPVPTPTTFASLESREYEVTFVGGSGVSEIDAEYDFSFPLETPVLSVIGTQVQLWPFKPNWKYALLERLEWKTDVLVHYDGSEQCIGLRTGPRWTLEYRAIASQVHRQRLNNLLWNWQANLFAVPLWKDVGHLSASALIGDSILYVETAYKDYHVGGLAALILDTGAHELVEIDAVAADSITLTDPLKNNWTIGHRIYPARVAIMETHQPITGHGMQIDELSVRFRFMEYFVITPDSGVHAYRGYPVLQEKPNWREGMESGLERKVAVIDSGSWFPVYDDETERPSRTQTYRWTYQGRPAIAGLMAWLYDRDGQRNPVWMSTGQNDLSLSAPIGASDVSLRVLNAGYTIHLSGQIGRRDVCIRLKDGTYFYRHVTGSIELSATEEQLNIGSNLGQAVAIAEIAKISFLEFCRMDADAVEIAWHTPELVESVFAMRGKNYDV